MVVLIKQCYFDGCGTDIDSQRRVFVCKSYTGFNLTSSCDSGSSGKMQGPCNGVKGLRLFCVHHNTVLWKTVIYATIYGSKPRMVIV